MLGTRTKAAVAGALILLAGAAPSADAGGGLHQATLAGFTEVPTVSTLGSGAFRATLTAGRINYTLRYSRMSGRVQQAHIHLGAARTTGGISAWLCDTAAVPGPAGTPDCPARRGTVTGVIRAARVVGPAGQGIAAGEFAELSRAIRAGVTYVNVHTVPIPAGEIRGQMR